MTVRNPRALTVMLLLCPLAACSTDAPLETMPPTEVHPVLNVVATIDTLFPVADAFTRHLSPNKNFGTVDTLTVRSFAASATNRDNVYVRFDQAAIASQVAGGQLDSARLEFGIWDVGSWGPTGDSLNVYRIPSSWAPDGWTETGITANCPNDTNPANAALNCPGGVWDTTGYSALTPTDQIRITNNTFDLARFDVTTDVAAFLAGAVNHGWHVAKAHNNNNQRIVLWSRESAEKPRLVLFVTRSDSNRPPVPDQPNYPDDSLYVVTDLDNPGPIYYRRLAWIQFTSWATDTEVTSFFTRFSAEVVGGVPATGTYYVRFPDPGSSWAQVDSVFHLMSEAPGIHLAIEIAQVLPKAPLDGRYPADSAR